LTAGFHIEQSLFEAIMDLSKLNALSTETLRDMNTHIVSVLRYRQSQKQMEAGSRLRIGGKAWFVNRNGRKVMVVVDKINVKTANCTEIGPDGNQLETAKWRVAPSLLTPEAVAVVGGDKPSTPTGVRW
jgi:hypothetical protein